MKNSKPDIIIEETIRMIDAYSDIDKGVDDQFKKSMRIAWMLAIESGLLFPLIFYYLYPAATGI